MHKGVIVTKYSEQAIPSGYMELVLKNNTSCFGMARVVEKDGVSEIEMASIPVGLSLKEFEDIQTDMLDSAAIFFFGQHPNGFSEESVQPIPIIRNGEQILMAGFAVGDFERWKQEKSGHSNEFFFLQTYLLPKLNKTMALLNDDFDKLVADMDDPVFKTEVLNCVGENGSIVLLAAAKAADKQLVFEKNVESTSGAFDWGWTTNHYGYETPAAAEEPAKPKTNALGALLSKVKGTAGPSSPLPKQENQPKAEAKPTLMSTVPTVKQEAHPPSGTNLAADRKIMAKPPANLVSKNQLRHWYKTKNGGIIPSNFQSRPEIELQGAARREYLENELKQKGQTSTAQIKPVTVASTEPVKQEPTVAPAETAPVAPAAPATAPSGPVEIMPVIPASEYKGLKEDFLTKIAPKSRYFDTNGQGMVDPDEIARREAKFPTFSEKLGLKDLSVISGWDFETLLHLVRQYPHASARLIMDLRYNFMVGQKKTTTAPSASSSQPAPAASASTAGVSTAPRRKLAI